jgi:hypothetical protein
MKTAHLMKLVMNHRSCDPLANTNHSKISILEHNQSIFHGHATKMPSAFKNFPPIECNYT